MDAKKVIHGTEFGFKDKNFVANVQEGMDIYIMNTFPATSTN